MQLSFRVTLTPGPNTERRRVHGSPVSLLEKGFVPVVEEEQVELADVGDEELVEAAGEHVAGLLVRA